MKKWIRLIFFLLAFQMEIRVRASASLLEQPEACLASKNVCSFQVKGKPLHLKQEAVVFHATEGSVFVRNTPNSWRFVKGALWVEKGSGVKIESLYGAMKSSQGQYWIIEQDSKILVRNINADLEVTLRDGKTLSIPDGFEFWMAGINTKGESEFGMIKPVNMQEHLPLWYSLFVGTKKEFIAEVNHVRDNWGDLVGKSSSLYKEVVLRRIASVQEKEEKENLRKEKLAAQRQQMKKLYHQRVFER